MKKYIQILIAVLFCLPQVSFAQTQEPLPVPIITKEDNNSDNRSLSLYTTAYYYPSSSEVVVNLYGISNARVSLLNSEFENVDVEYSSGSDDTVILAVPYEPDTYYVIITSRDYSGQGTFSN